jgi:DHA2 family multidrug resistance protein
VKRSELLITLTMMLGVIMAVIDMTIVNVALPTMSGNLGCSLDDAAWVSTGYILAAVIIMPLTGWMTAYFGRKRFYTGAVIIFTVASFLCGISRDIVTLTIFRMLQGLGGGVLQPTAQAILFETFGTNRSGTAMTIFGLGVMAAPALGPVLGGYIVDNASWPLIFFINVPIGLLTLFMALGSIPSSRHIVRTARSVDWVALFFMASGLISLQYVLERGQHEDWWDSGTIVALSCISVICLSAFAVKTALDKEPLVNLKVFRIPTFSLGNILLFVVGFGLFGSELIVPLFFQNILGMTALDSGKALIPGAIATAVTMVFTNRIPKSVDVRVTLVVGALCVAWSNWQLGGLTLSAGMENTFYPRLLLGAGIGLLFIPLTRLMLSAVPRHELAGATGLSQLVRQLGGSFGIAIITTLLSHQTAVAWNALAAGMKHSHDIAPSTQMNLLSQSSAINAYNYVFQICAIIFALSIPLILFVRRPDHPAAAPAAPTLEAAH